MKRLSSGNSQIVNLSSIQSDKNQKAVSMEIQADGKMLQKYQYGTVDLPQKLNLYFSMFVFLGVASKPVLTSNKNFTKPIGIYAYNENQSDFFVRLVLQTRPANIRRLV